MGMAPYDTDQIFARRSCELFDWTCPDSFFDPAAEIHFAFKKIFAGQTEDPDSLLRELGPGKSQMLLEVAEKALAYPYIQIDELFDAPGDLAAFFDRFRCSREKLLIDPGPAQNAKPRRLFMV